MNEKVRSDLRRVQRMIGYGFGRNGVFDPRTDAAAAGMDHSSDDFIDDIDDLDDTFWEDELDGAGGGSGDTQQCFRVIDLSQYNLIEKRSRKYQWIGARIPCVSNCAFGCDLTVCVVSVTGGIHV